MDCHVHSELPMVFASIGIIISLLLMSALQPSLSQSPPSNNHSLCLHQPYRCGKLEAYYPFWGGNRSRQCGGDDKLQLSCMEENDSGYGGQPRKFYTYIEMRSQRFNVVEIENLINYSRVKLAPLPVDDGGADVCSGNSDYSLDYPLYTYNQTVHNITVFYDCSNSHPDKHNINCYGSVVYYHGTEEEVLESHQDLHNCDQHIQVAAEAVLWSYVEGDDDASALHFSEGVWVKVNYTFSQDCTRCVESKGRCGWSDTHPFSCHCPDGSNALPCPHTGPPPVPSPGPPPDNSPQRKSMSLLSPHIFLVQFPTLVMIIQVSSFILPSYAWIKD